MTKKFSAGDTATLTVIVAEVDDAGTPTWIKIPLHEFGLFNGVRVTGDDAGLLEKTR